MTAHLGKVPPGSTILVPFHTFDSEDPSASVIISGFALADIGIYKGTSTTERGSTTGVVLLDTDGIDIDLATGIHGFSIDLSSNATADFYTAGAHYYVTVGPITIDAATVNFVAATFSIGYSGALWENTLASVTSQTVLVLDAGSADDDAYNGCTVIVHDIASAIQTCVGYVTDYVGSSLTMTLGVDPAVFTMAAGDNISIMPRPLHYANFGRAAGVIVVNAAKAGTLTATAMSTNLTEATDDHYIGRTIIWTSGVLIEQASDITDYANTNGVLTYSTVTDSPSAGDTFVLV